MTSVSVGHGQIKTRFVMSRRQGMRYRVNVQHRNELQESRASEPWHLGEAKMIHKWLGATGLDAVLYQCDTVH